MAEEHNSYMSNRLLISYSTNIIKSSCNMSSNRLIRSNSTHSYISSKHRVTLLALWL